MESPRSKKAIDDDSASGSGSGTDDFVVIVTRSDSDESPSPLESGWLAGEEVIDIGKLDEEQVGQCFEGWIKAQELAHHIGDVDPVPQMEFPNAPKPRIRPKFKEPIPVQFPNGLSGTVVRITSSFMGVLCHPVIQQTLQRKLPKDFPLDEVSHPTMANTAVGLVSQVVIQPVTQFLTWLSTNRIREYERRIRSEHLEQELEQRLLDIGQKHWKGKLDEDFSEQYVLACQGLEIPQKKRLFKTRDLLNERQHAESKLRLEEVVGVVGNTVDTVFSLIQRELRGIQQFAADPKDAPSNEELGLNDIAPILSDTHLALEDASGGPSEKSIRHHITDTTKNVGMALKGHLPRRTLQAFFRSYLMPVGHPTPETAALLYKGEDALLEHASTLTQVLVGNGQDFVSRALERVLTVLLQQKLPNITVPCVILIKQHLLAYFELQKAIDTREVITCAEQLNAFHQASMGTSAALHSCIAIDGSETRDFEFWMHDVIPDVLALLGEPEAARLVLKLGLPELYEHYREFCEQNPGMAFETEAQMGGHSKQILRLMIPSIAKKLDRFLTPAFINGLLIKKIEMRWKERLGADIFNPHWAAYHTELARLKRAKLSASNHLYQQSKKLIHHSLSYFLDNSKLPGIAGLKEMIVGMALTAHASLQNKALTKSLAFNLIKIVLTELRRHKIHDNDEVREALLGQKIEHIRDRTLLNDAVIRKLVEAGMELFESGQGTLPSETSTMGRIFMGVASKIASRAEGWIKPWITRLVQKHAKSVLDYSMADAVEFCLKQANEHLGNHEGSWLTRKLDSILPKASAQLQHEIGAPRNRTIDALVDFDVAARIEKGSALKSSHSGNPYI